MRRSVISGIAAVSLVLSAGCTKTEGDVDPLSLPPEQRDADGDQIPDFSEDRNRNGRVDPGETDPSVGDTDRDGIADTEEVMTIACSPVMDRPFRVIDAPGASSMVLVDAAVREKAWLRTPDGRSPGLQIADPDLNVAAIMLRKQPASGVRSPAAQREVERRGAISSLGRITDQSTRVIMTVEGFDGEQAIFRVQANQAMSAKLATEKLGSAMLNGAPLIGTMPSDGPQGTELVVQLLTIWRSMRRVVLLAAVVVGEPDEAQQIRLEELTDGTNVARHASFTRHLCDEDEAKAEAKADIIFVVDDSGSMEDDQMAVREAASAMESVLAAAQVDYRLGVARTRATDRNTLRRGALEGLGMTDDLDVFKRRIVVGADGGWEPGLETGIKALDRLLPRTAVDAAPEPRKLRGGAATIVIHMSDERDQSVECAACGGCDGAEGEQRFCNDPAGQRVIDDYSREYNSRGAVTFALVGDLPIGCQQPGARDDFEPGQGYVEVANATGGKFGSLCGDMSRNLMDIARVATGVASAYTLSGTPASASIRVAIGPPGQGRAIKRSRVDGFDYDPVQNSVIFYGSAQPQDGDEVVVGYRRWDWANNPGSPSDPCDECEMHTACLPELDIAACEPLCGDVICDPGLACHPDTGDCAEPGTISAPPADACGECDAGLVCDPVSTDCVPPCESEECDPGQFCNEITMLCEAPNL